MSVDYLHTLNTRKPSLPLVSERSSERQGQTSVIIHLSIAKVQTHQSWNESTFWMQQLQSSEGHKLRDSYINTNISMAKDWIEWKNGIREWNIIHVIS